MDFLNLVKSFGPWAVIWAVMALAIWYQYRTTRAREKELVDALSKEQSARVEDAKKYAELMIDLQSKAYSTVEVTLKRLHDEDKSTAATNSLIDILRGVGDKKGAR